MGCLLRQRTSDADTFFFAYLAIDFPQKKPASAGFFDVVMPKHGHSRMDFSDGWIQP
jgi:hypothetical protein